MNGTDARYAGLIVPSQIPRGICIITFFGFLMFLSMLTFGFNFLFLPLFPSRVSSVQSGIYFLVGILLFVLPVPCLGIAYLPFSLLLTAVQFFPFFNLYGNKFIMCTSYNVA